MLQLGASGPFCLDRVRALLDDQKADGSQGLQRELNIWLPLSLKVYSAMSGQDQNEFQAVGWHLLKETYQGVSVHVSFCPRLSNSNILCKRA